MAKKDSSSSSNSTSRIAIVTCKCNHTFQDLTYGIKRRVANRCGTKDNYKYRCTVCLTEHKK